MLVNESYVSYLTASVQVLLDAQLHQQIIYVGNPIQKLKSILKYIMFIFYSQPGLQLCQRCAIKLIGSY